MSEPCRRTYGHMGPCSPLIDAGLMAALSIALDGPCGKPLEAES